MISSRRSRQGRSRDTCPEAGPPNCRNIRTASMGMFSSPRTESLDVPAIFLQKRLRAIFRMTLKVDKETFLFLSHKQVDASLGRFGQDE